MCLDIDNCHCYPRDSGDLGVSDSGSESSVDGFELEWIPGEETGDVPQMNGHPVGLGAYLPDAGGSGALSVSVRLSASASASPVVLSSTRASASPSLRTLSHYHIMPQIH